MIIARPECFALNMTIAFKDIKLFRLAVTMPRQTGSGHHPDKRSGDPCFVVNKQLFNQNAFLYFLPFTFIRANG